MYFMPNGRIANVWDNHGGTAGLGGITGYAMLREKYCIPPLDRAYSALLEDLAQRGLLDETLVVAVGEFGRTPKINATQGRDHWGMCQSALLAGGGVRGGQVYGASDAQAAYVKDNPVSPEDLLATIYHALGVPPDSEVRDRAGRPYRVSEGKPVSSLFG
jgi:arylsulfatase A-like enzyme